MPGAHALPCSMTPAAGYPRPWRSPPERIDLTGRAIVFETLKKRRCRSIYRAVPVPPDQLDLVHGVREAQRRGKGHADRPLWSWARNTACRRVTAVMVAAG